MGSPKPCKAVIASHVGGVPKIALDNTTSLLVPDDDALAIAQALTRLAADSALRQTLRTARQARA